MNHTRYASFYVYVSLNYAIFFFFQKILEPRQNCRRQNGNMKRVPYCGRQNIRRHLPKFGCPGDLTPENCASPINRKFIWSPYWIFGLNYRTDFQKCKENKKCEKFSSLEEFFCHNKTMIVLQTSYKYGVCGKSRYSIKKTKSSINLYGSTDHTTPPPPQKTDKYLPRRNGKISVHILEM